VSGYPGARVGQLGPGDPVRFGQYELVGRLGQGGMGTVYLARRRHGEPVALKVVRPDLAADSEFRARFRSEVHRARQVPPFCTAEVLDADPDHEFPYLVIEYVDGPCLAEVVEERGPLTAANLHALAIGVATALTAIHGAGVVHRDLKPRNVLLAPTGPKVIDFGIARAMDVASELTRTNQMLGTVAYMAPERFDSDSRMPLGPAADVFAWGAVIAYAGTGRTPFHADSPPATAARILTQPPDLASLPPQLQGLVECSLAKDPQDRPNARELLDLLLGSGPQAATIQAVFDDRPELRDAARGVAARRFGAEVTGRTGRPAGRQDAAPRLDASPARRGLRWQVVAAAVAVVAVLGATWFFRDGLSARNPSAGRAPASSSAAAVVEGTVVIKDELVKDALWQAHQGQQGSCAFRDDNLVAKLIVTGYFLCRGPPQDLAGDQLIAVDVTLSEAGGCASIYFLIEDDSYYELETCREKVVLNRHEPERLILAGAFTLSSPVPPGDPTRVTLRIVGARLQVSHDDRAAGEMPVDPELVRKGGTLTIGLFGGDGAEPPFEVAFGHFEARSLG
jgi:predicted Ser/Thr protein kinase